jgi:hypothetical protein
MKIKKISKKNLYVYCLTLIILKVKTLFITRQPDTEKDRTEPRISGADSLAKSGGWCSYISTGDFLLLSLGCGKCDTSCTSDQLLELLLPQIGTGESNKFNQ